MYKRKYVKLSTSEKEEKYLGQIADSLLSLYDRKDELVDSWEKPWSTTRIQSAPMNGITEHEYQGKNGLSLWLNSMLKGYNDPRWVTFNQVTAEGGNVKKGEKGITIKYFKNIEKIPDRDPSGKIRRDKDGNEITKEVTLTKPIVRYVTVFNLNQCENIPLTSCLSKPISIPEQPKNYNVINEDAEHYLKASGAKLSNDGGNRAFYRPSTDDIHLPKIENFNSSIDYYHTAFHELTHWTGAEHRLNRPFGMRPSKSYAREEFVADLGSHLICRDLHLVGEKSAEQLMGYLGGWYQAIDNSNNKEKFREELIDALKSGFEAQNYLNNQIRSYEQKHPQDIQSQNNRIYLNVEKEDQIRYAIENQAILDAESQKFYITYAHDVTLFKGLITNYEEVLKKYEIHLNQTETLKSENKDTINKDTEYKDTEEDIHTKEVKQANAPSKNQDENQYMLKYVFCNQFHANNLKPEQNFAIVNKESGLCYLEEQAMKSQPKIIDDIMFSYDSFEEAENSFIKCAASTGSLEDDFNSTMLNIQTIRSVSVDKSGNVIPNTLSEPLRTSTNPDVEKFKKQYAIKHEENRVAFQLSLFDEPKADIDVPVKPNEQDIHESKLLEKKTNHNKTRFVR